MGYHNNNKTKGKSSRDGEVILSLKRLGSKIGKDILSNEDMRPLLSSLSKSDGLEAVEELRKSIYNRPSHLDPIADPAGYFLKILNRYTTSLKNKIFQKSRIFLLL